VPHDAIIRWENEGGALLPGAGVGRTLATRQSDLETEPHCFHEPRAALVLPRERDGAATGWRNERARSILGLERDLRLPPHKGVANETA
jgi:hypothetical protein